MAESRYYHILKVKLTAKNTTYKYTLQQICTTCYTAVEAKNRRQNDCAVTAHACKENA